ncbi:hypothetical protein [Coleofasciculus sp. FACHB-SPT9]|uniref:hypothetical protein n=1 Tax=Cyanophyceae TaxID=3028117 RepID=UPI0016885E04|nr:hypothetical protein [Coleofasciculus sp. FACHB-SPT9]MBD1889505.1 hypothetical protein [Coleofasciculus sp. FACHB-SPT9]
MGWKSYELDRAAQKLVLDARERDPKSLNQSHKMRMAVAYGLERFWGEHLRLKGKKVEDENKSKFWKATWDALAKVMDEAGVTIPNDPIHPNSKGELPTGDIQAMSAKLWQLPIQDQRVALAVLTQLCDCIVWWTQRYKTGRLADEIDS